jgi:hypothetical protein
MFHLEVCEDLGHEALLVDGEEPSVSPLADVASQKPLGVTTVSDCKFVLDLGGGKVGFCLQVRHKK